jgi:hypothetical protein
VGRASHGPPPPACSHIRSRRNGPPPVCVTPGLLLMLIVVVRAIDLNRRAERVVRNWLGRACLGWSAVVGGCRTPRCIRTPLIAARARGPAAAVDELFLEGREERFGDGVVVRVSAGAHRDRDCCVAGGAPERQRYILGELNWSSQRLREEGCDGQASWVDEGVDGPVGDGVAGGTIRASGCGAVVLA